MAYAILRVDVSDANIFRRKVLLSNVDTRASAVAALERHLAEYEDHGRDNKQDRWWAKDKGKQYDFWIEGEGQRDPPKLN